MFDILMYLFENYVHSEADMFADQDDLTDELTKAGFHKDEIYKALSWLEKLTSLQESYARSSNQSANPSSMRIYTEEEVGRLDTQSRGFLLFLEQINVLDFDTREMVIDRVMEIDTSFISLDDLKWVILMVLFNVPGHENAYAQMEDLIFDDYEGPLH